MDTLHLKHTQDASQKGEPTMWVPRRRVEARRRRDSLGDYLFGKVMSDVAWVVAGCCFVAIGGSFVRSFFALTGGR